MFKNQLEIQVGDMLRERGWTISAAESCTGGLVISRLTDIAGSSAYVLGGVITYSNEAKQQLVNVQNETLMQYGAVSEQTAREMAIGAQALFQTDIAVSVTGIAGPGGGTADKPVGLTFIALATSDGQTQVHHYVWEGNRIENKIASADAVFKLILEFANES